MCLRYDSYDTKILKLDNRHRKTINVYKVYRKQDNKLFPPIRDGKHISSGIIRSNRFTTRFPIKGEQHGWDLYIYRGIHVHLRKQRPYRNHVVVECTAYMADLVGVNFGGAKAVFTEIHLTKKEYNRVTVPK